MHNYHYDRQIYGSLVYPKKKNISKQAFEPGRYEEAHCFIFSYSRCLRHGLIPNLLADDKIARYNSCCSIWWGLCTTSNYINTVPDGDEIFSDIVSRVHPTHNSSTTRQVRVNEERCP
ncbi:unnamed protein product [Rotaria socialis]|uniref:Glycogen debranching enzyme C-terminal domain-containing protein n=1 Tax=Rotaria socialis TaxID=392032 RepID=A0A820IQ62_9BILA|nr:unnamed protein product [Rotaria socialis]